MVAFLGFFFRGFQNFYFKLFLLNVVKIGLLQMILWFCGVCVF